MSLFDRLRGEAQAEPSALLPAFLRELSDPAVQTVLLVGCGGGFDFVHSMTLYPELKRLRKKVIVGSYSFGDPGKIGDPAEVVFSEGSAVAKKVTASSVPARHYSPEIHVCSFLDATYPAEAPHFLYAYYARAFTVPTLRRWYQQLVETHRVDAIVLFDGGSDSLMAGDEEGLGDPIEDAVSVATASLLGLRSKILVSIGLGADRFNQVSDASSLRAIAELTRLGGFRGALGLDPSNPGFAFYRRCLETIYERQGFRSVLSGAIVAAGEGWFGSEDLPPLLQTRVRPGELYLWPLMPLLWAFDVDTVARRSMIVSWIRECETVLDCRLALEAGRRTLGAGLRPIENLPRHEDMRFDPER